MKAPSAPAIVDPLDAVLSKGLAEATPTTTAADEVSVRIRFPGDLHKRLTVHLNALPGRVSINTFVMQAVVAKLNDDQR